jgi:hypothetical protein
MSRLSAGQADAEKFGSSNGGAGDASFLLSSSLGILRTVQPDTLETATNFGADSRAPTAPTVPAPSEKLVDVLHGFALADPDRKLFDWLDDKGDIVNAFSRGELWNRGRLLADRLEKDGIKRGDFVMIVYP